MQRKTLIKCILLPLAVGAVSGFLTRNGMKDFMQIAQPALTPPPWVFPIVWTILYIMMGIASYHVLVAEADSKSKATALSLYGAQLFFNFWWSIVYFNLKNYLFAFIWLIAMWLLIIATTLEFRKISKKAALMMIPYLLWTTFAAYLNYGVYVLNR